MLFPGERTEAAMSHGILVRAVCEWGVPREWREKTQNAAALASAVFTCISRNSEFQYSTMLLWF